MGKLWSVEVGTQPPPQGETMVHRNARHPQSLVDHASTDIRTIYGAIEYSAIHYPKRPLLGARKLLDIVREDKVVTKLVDGKEVKQTKQWEYKSLSDYDWMTSEQAFAYSKELGSGLMFKGLQEKDYVLFAAPTSREWMLMLLAASAQRISVVTAYDTLGVDGLLHAQKQSKVPVMFIGAEKMDVAVKVAEKADGLRMVVYFGRNDQMEMSVRRLQEMNIDVISVEELHDLGMQHMFPVNPAQPDDLALVMYTSGSTGAPKGVLILHRNIICVSGSIDTFLNDYIVDEDECLLSYLPLAHILEIMVEVYVVFKGIRMGYGSVRTLMDENVRGCKGDIATLKPTIMLGVPQVWDTIRGGILRAVESKGKLVSSIFNVSITFKNWLLKHNIPTFIVDPLFKQIKQMVGGRLKFVISGGAPISSDSQNFIRAVICNMIQGYGMTECSGLVSVQEPSDLCTDTVGPPCSSVEIKLVDAKQSGYFAKNNQGEIWLHGPSVFQGYLLNEEETKKTLTDDGWIRTGDVGQWRPDGQLAIIDRVKNLVKLANGEYIAIEKIESIYKTSLLVNNICVCADSESYHPVCLVCPNPDALTSWAKNNNVSFTNWKDLCSKPEAKRCILQNLQQVGNKAQMIKPEIVVDVALDPVEWSPENNLLTAAAKLRRHQIQQLHEKDLKKLYVTAKKH